MKKSIIEVCVPTENVPRVEPVFVQCLQETQDTLIGKQTFDDLSVFVVQLRTNDTAKDHLKVLAPAFHDSVITSFQFLSCYLCKCTFQTADYRTSTSRFPLRGGESMFPSANEENTVYFCLISPTMSRKQLSWLAEEENRVQWTEIP